MSMPRRKSAGATTLRLEVLLDGGRAAHHLGLAGEDARQRLRIGDLVEAAAADLADHPQQRLVDAAAEAHGADR